MASERFELRNWIGQKVVPSYIINNVVKSTTPQTLISQIINQLLTFDIADVKYFQSLLKLYNRKLERDGMSLDEDLTLLYAELVVYDTSKVLDSDLCNVSYFVSETERVILKESPQIISRHGSTGHRTWEAALGLADYLIENTNSLYSTRAVELGSGTGLSGLVLHKLHPEMDLLLTDGDHEVVERLAGNIKMNLVKEDTRNVSAQYLLWGETPVPSNTELVIASDVTYDTRIVPALVKCLSQLKQVNEKLEIIVAAMIRSENTFQVFRDECEKYKFQLELLRTYNNVQPCKWFYIPESAPEVRIYKVAS